VVNEYSWRWRDVPSLAELFMRGGGLRGAQADIMFVVGVLRGSGVLDCPRHVKALVSCRQCSAPRLCGLVLPKLRGSGVATTRRIAAARRGKNSHRDRLQMKNPSGGMEVGGGSLCEEQRECECPAQGCEFALHFGKARKFTGCVFFPCEREGLLRPLRF